MKTYCTPTVNLLKLYCQDILTTSGNVETTIGDDPHSGDHGWI